MSDERYCSNCRAEVPKGAVVCPVCGVYAGDVFDGKKPKSKSARVYASWLVIPLAIALFALVWTWQRWQPTETQRVRAALLRSVKRDIKHQRDVTLLIRRQLVAKGLPESCLALVGKGNREAQRYLAIDICHDRPMGEWTADPETGAVTRLK